MFGAIVSAARLFTYLRGGRIIVFLIAPREGNYSYITSSDLPGFAMLLQPGEADSVKFLIDAIDAPLRAYLEAENRRISDVRASQRAPMQPMHRPVLRGWGQWDNKLIAAASCAKSARPSAKLSALPAL